MIRNNRCRCGDWLTDPALRLHHVWALGDNPGSSSTLFHARAREAGTFRLVSTIRPKNDGFAQ
jgi:hypothetical protein